MKAREQGVWPMGTGSYRVKGMVLIITVVLSGCWESKRPLEYIGDASLNYYKDKATEIDYTAVCQPPDPAATCTLPPRSIHRLEKDEIWELTLSEAMHIALTNSKILQTRATLLTPGGPLFNAPDQISSVFDPAIQESGVLFGRRSVEAALADFDTQLTTQMLWGRDERVQNSAFAFAPLGLFATPPALVQETAQFNARLQKQFAYGGTFAVNHNWNYLGTNQPGVLFPSTYTGLLSAEYRQPLWAGSGSEFTHIAGPSRAGFGAITGVSQGVWIARINQDLTLADFEANVRNMLKDVEDIYWDLYQAYYNYRIAVDARNAAYGVWRRAQDLLDAEADIRPADVQQALDQYFAFREGAEIALNNLFAIEVELRRLLSLPVNDGKVIRPADEPVVASYTPEWYMCLAEALTERVELRRQKWNIKSLELQYIAAQSLVHPQFDFVSSYQVNAFGDRLFGQNDNDGITRQGLNSAYETLTQGDHTGWNMGFEFSMPIGFRQARSQVRNVELRLVKSRQVLATQEREVAYQLAQAYKEVFLFYQTAQTNLNRQEAAAKRVEFEQIELDAGTGDLDRLLRAQQSLADAELAYVNSVVRYNKAINSLYFFKGTLLSRNNVHLEEAMWHPEAHRQAYERAVARSHAIDAPWLDNEPGAVEIHAYPAGMTLEPPACPPGATQDVLPLEEPAPLPPAAPGNGEPNAGDSLPGEEVTPSLPDVPTPEPTPDAVHIPPSRPIGPALKGSQDSTEPVADVGTWKTDSE